MTSASPDYVPSAADIVGSEVVVEVQQVRFGADYTTSKIERGKVLSYGHYGFMVELATKEMVLNLYTYKFSVGSNCYNPQIGTKFSVPRCVAKLPADKLDAIRNAIRRTAKVVFTRVGYIGVPTGTVVIHVKSMATVEALAKCIPETFLGIQDVSFEATKIKCVPQWANRGKLQKISIQYSEQFEFKEDDALLDSVKLISIYSDTGIKPIPQKLLAVGSVDNFANSLFWTRT